MGCPDFYYKRALQYLSYNLTCFDDMKSAKELLGEESEEKLEHFLLDKKNQINEKQFYYNAGIAWHEVLDEARNTGNDALNASIGGLTEFEYFIGIQEDDEEE